MYSDRLVVRDNVSDGDRDHGLLMNFVKSSEVAGNVVRGGNGKCLFIYNAHMNRIHDNRFEGCPIGIHFTAGSERNRVSGNAFRSEEHTSELQSLMRISYAVFCLKKKKNAN